MEDIDKFADEALEFCHFMVGKKIGVRADVICIWKYQNS